MSELNGQVAQLAVMRSELEEKDQQIAELMGMQKDSDQTVEKLTDTIEKLKSLNVQTVEKGEELKQ